MDKGQQVIGVIGVMSGRGTAACCIHASMDSMCLWQAGHMPSMCGYGTCVWLQVVEVMAYQSRVTAALTRPYLLLLHAHGRTSRECRTHPVHAVDGEVRAARVRAHNTRVRAGRRGEGGRDERVHVEHDVWRALS